VSEVKRLLAVLAVALALPASALAWGGVYPTGDQLGTSVRIDVSDAYPVDQALPQLWATYLGTLVHGSELAKLRLELAPLPEVQAQCGAQALACYDPGSETILASPEDELYSPVAREVVAHEYGHHVANNRSDAPWSAEDSGTKRWASYENICARTAKGDLSPGDESTAYTENPGEAFAESYRVLNLAAAGATDPQWNIVDPKLFPDRTALALLKEDVLHPWTGNSLSVLHGSFGYGAARTFALKTTLDGSLVATLHAPTTAKLRLSLWEGKSLLARGTSVRYEICGARALTLKVDHLSGHGAFTVSVSKP